MDFDSLAADLAIAEASASSGVPAELLTTHSRIFPSLKGEPYCRMVCLIDRVGEDDPMRWRWEKYLWDGYRKSLGPKDARAAAAEGWTLQPKP